MTNPKCPNCNRELKKGRSGEAEFYYCDYCDREKKKSSDFKENLSRGRI